MGAVSRIKEYLDYKSITRYKFYQKVGLSNGFLDKGENIGSDKCEKIFKEYPDINVEWLLTGQGEMLKNVLSTMLNNDNSTSDNPEKMYGDFDRKMYGTDKNLPKNDFSNEVPMTTNTPTICDNKYSRSAVPFYDLPVSAGALGVVDIGDEKNANGFVDMPIFANCDRVLPVVGVSMEPVIYSGDFVGIKTIPNLSSRWDFLQTGKIYLIVTRDDRMIKYLNQASDSEYIVCSSPNYSPFKIHKSEILQLFRVAAIARGV